MRRAIHTSPATFLRAAIKQALHICKLKAIRIARSSQAPIARLIFWPGRPHPYSVAYRACHLLGIRAISRVPKNGECGILWLDATFVPKAPINGLINRNCLDISKKNVEKIHQEIFGYGLAIDPKTHSGHFVIKSDLNGAHDGKVVNGPVFTTDPDSVYQIAVDNRPLDGSINEVCDFRVPVFHGKPAFVYLKFRPLTNRFSNLNSRVDLVQDTCRLFTQNEIGLIGEFCEEAGLDYGEIDIVRDWGSKKIYILDINKTPLGPPNGLSAENNSLAMDLYLKAFTQFFNDHRAF